jgi:ATP-binding cassette subfamily B protein
MKRWPLLRAVAWTLRSPIEAAPGLMARHTLVNVIAYSAQAPIAFGLKLIVDGVAGRHSTMALLGVGIASLAGFLQYVAWRTSLGMQALLDERHTLHTDRRLARLVGEPPGLVHLESPAYLDHHALVASKRWYVVQMPKHITAVIGLLVSLVPTLYLLGQINLLLLPFPLFGVLALFVSGYAAAARFSLDTRLAESRRMETSLFNHLTSPRTAKEIRVFGLAGELTRRMRLAAQDVDRGQARHEMRAGGLALLADSVYVLGYAAALLLVTEQVLQGRASAGDVVLVAMLGLQMSAQIAITLDSLRVMGDGVQSSMHELKLWDHHREQMAQLARRTEAEPERLEVGIRLEGVSFRYPDMERAALSDVDVLLPAGSIVALVGANGAGKSTLVKLVCGFYEPTGGRILLDDVPLSGVDPRRWRRRLSGAFQDYAELELTVGESVGVGDLTRLDDELAVSGALERAGGGRLLRDLPSGLATQLGASFAGGRQLSGGQWQMVALGRSFMRETPLLLVLDEPTAALDPDAERMLFDRYVEAARRTRASNGGITLLVSHRFSTVRSADLVLVVEGGRLVEHGSHDELMRRGGLYSEMYELQARAYR